MGICAAFLYDAMAVVCCLKDLLHTGSLVTGVVDVLDTVGVVDIVDVMDAVDTLDNALSQT
eukprot:15365014-Ditylum_brightwellii.AAC.1